MSESSKRPNREAKVFDLSWETDEDPEETVHAEEHDEAGDDFEGHGASGFNRPSTG